MALLILGLLATLAGVAVGSLQPSRSEPWKAAVTRARDSAIRNGQPVIMTGHSGFQAVLLPDGRAIGPGLDPLTGEFTSAPH